MQYLDIIKNIKKIPDCNFLFALKRIMTIFNNMKPNKIKSLITLSLNYPPSTKALLGAILQELKYDKYISELHQSLNPISKYSFPEAQKVLSYSKEWNIS